MQAKQPKAPIQKGGTSIAQIVGAYTPYWPLFVVCLIFFGAAAKLYLRYTIPKYEANATIIIKDEKKGYDDSKLMESLDLINTKKIIENEIEVLQSRTIMNSVVTKLHLYAPIFQQGKLKSISAYQISPFLVEAQNPDSLKECKRIDVEYNLKNGNILLDKVHTVVMGQWFNTPYGTLRFIHNDKYAPTPENKPYHFSLVPVKNVVGSILDNLKVTASSKLSSVIDLSYRDEVPKRAEDILNELIQAYSNAALAEKNSLAKNTLKFIEERLTVVSKDLDSIEGKQQQYKSGKGAVDIGKQGQLYLENSSNNDKRLSDLNMQLAVMAQLEKSATSSGNIGLISSTLGVTDPSLTQQMNSLSSLQMQYEKLKSTVGENNPYLLSITEQINQLKPTILNNIQSQQKSLEQSRDNLLAAGGSYNSILSALPQKERQLVEITRDQNIKNGIYSFLLQKREESELSYASTIADSRVVNYAETSRFAVSPNKLMIYLIAIIFAMGCPIAYVTARETLSPKILYRNEIESLTNIPIIGEISFIPVKEPSLIESGSRTILAEEFRKIRVSLLSLGINNQYKKILVTSSIAGEGKSFIAANLATSLSLTGKKVALVDIDLHSPGLGKIFNIKDQEGISEFLMGTRNLKQIIYNIPGNENLFYISSGKLQRDASELLENGKIQSLIAQLNEDFDIVIIDSAPIVLITDAYLLSSLCDATLYVVRHKHTPKILMKRIDENMGINPINNPGIIFNGVKERGFFKNNYGYGYNYVYGYENKKKKNLLNKFFSNKNSA